MIWNDCVIVEAARSVARIVRGHIGGVVAILLLSLLAVGCNTDKDTAAKIARAEAIAEEHPDSALRIVRSIDAERVRGKHDRAHYQLVVAEAHYYNYLIPDRKTIAQPLFDYYIDSDNHAERARALYQYALVMQSEGEKARAIYSLLEAEESLSHINNPRLAGLIHRTKGDIYGWECLFQNALEEYQKAKECFDRVGLVYHSIYCDYDIARAYNDFNQFDKAEQHLTIALNYAIANNLQSFLVLVLDVLLEVNVSSYQFDKAEDIILQYEKILIEHPATYYPYRAICAAHKGDRANAQSSLDLALQSGCNEDKLEYTSYIVYRSLNDDDKALMYLENCIKTQNEHTLSSLNVPILNLQIELDAREIERLQIRNENIKLRYTLLITIIIILLIVPIVYYRYKQLKQRQEIEQHITTISELQMTTRNLPHMMRIQINDLYKSRFKELNTIYDTYYDSLGSDRQMKIVFTQLHNTIDALKNDKKRFVELEKIINEYRDNIVTKLREQCPNLTERQIKIAIYSYAGFSLRAISIFVNSNPKQISKDKYKIKSIIEQSDSIDKDILITSL